MRFLLTIIVFLLPAWGEMIPKTAYAQIISGDAVSAELISETASIEPGCEFWVGVRLSMAPGWHVNWVNPGDAGLPPTVEWTLPEGFVAGPIEWPVPVRHELPGLSIFGYENVVVLLTRIKAPKTIEAGTTARIAASVDWLACREGCVPGDAAVELSLPILDDPPGTDSKWTDVIKTATDALPSMPTGWRIGAALKTDVIAITAEPADPSTAADPGDVYFFPHEQGIIDNTGTQTWTRSERGFTLTMPRAKMGKAELTRLRGVLVFGESRNAPVQTALELDVPITSELE